MSRVAWPAALLATAALWLAACATPPQTAALRATPNQQAPVELTGVAFFPQNDYQCGPAALATVLRWSGLDITPDALTPQLYLPSRQGSLQAELIAATRRQGRIPYVLRPQFDDLLDELRAGHPALVLLNLGLSWYPVWHYAVVVGFDLDRDQIILRSGRLRREVLRVAVFERLWARSGYWALLTLSPVQLPASVEETSYLQAVVELERLRQWRNAASAYETALVRWPGSLGAALGLGNCRYELGDLNGAEHAFRHAIAHHADAAPAWNNLAQVLLEQGRHAQARRAVQRAIDLGGPLRETYEETLQQIIKQERSARH